MSNLPNEIEAILTVAVEAARAAGDILRKEFNRPGGPRGDKSVNKAEADRAAEKVIYDRLSASFPDYGFLAEEDHYVLEHSGYNLLWVVDPNDGTRSYLEGFRGAAVSIALLEGGKPILGVVYLQLSR